MRKKYKFQYKSLRDPKYIKDKLDFFRESGNGWWWIDKSRNQGRYKPKRG